MMSGWEFGWFFMLPIWLLLAVVIMLVVQSLTRRDEGGARRILDERFATGELSAEEYEQRRRALR